MHKKYQKVALLLCLVTSVGFVSGKSIADDKFIKPLDTETSATNEKPKPAPTKPTTPPAKPPTPPVKPPTPPVKPPTPPVKPPTPPVKPPTPPVKPPTPPVKPPTPPVKPPVKPPAPPKKTEPTTPVTHQQQQQKQQEAKQNLEKQTAAAKKSIPPAVASKIPAGAQAKLSGNGKSLAVKDPKTGSTQVLDAKTGKPLASYNKTTGTSATTPPKGAVTREQGGVKTITAPGYSKTIDKNGNARTVVNNTTIHETVVNKTTVVVNRSVTINNKVIVLHEDRPMMRTFDPYHGGYVRLFVPAWWGAAAVMTTAWLVGDIHVYGSFFGINGYLRAGYASPWNPGFGFVSWNANPYLCIGNCWGGYYQRWGWGWATDNYYPGYYTPIYTYRHLGWWIADYLVQRELETERLERLAAYQDAAYRAQEAQEWAANASALAQVNEPVSPDVMETLANQTQDLVASIKDGEQLFASQEVTQGHIFTVDTELRETATIDGLTYDCKLKAGDLIQPDPNAELDVEPVLGDDGLPVVDEFGNVENTTYVTMNVVASKMHSCVKGSSVIVQMDTLQSLFTDEKARVIEGMEQSIVLGVQP